MSKNIRFSGSNGAVFFFCLKSRYKSDLEPILQKPNTTAPINSIYTRTFAAAGVTSKCSQCNRSQITSFFILFFPEIFLEAELVAHGGCFLRHALFERTYGFMACMLCRRAHGADGSSGMTCSERNG